MIYLDNHATTPVDPCVLEAMLPYLQERFGNASSRSHRSGWEAEQAVETARGQVAEALGVEAREIVFTSGATESNNLALLGAAARLRERGNRILASPIEHPSVADTLKELGRRGFEVEYLGVDAGGCVDPEELRGRIDERTILVTVMAANNEVGSIQPLREIGAVARERGVLFHTDATQAVGKIPFDVLEVDAHLVALTAHKIYGPKGCGALYVRRKDPAVELAPQVFGGGQERGLRPGTLNVPGIVGLGKACELARLELEEEMKRIRTLRDRLQERLLAELEGVEINGDPARRLPGNLHVSFEGVDNQSLMMAVPELAVSSGSACASGSIEPSHVLKAMGVPPERARSSIRFGIGRFNTAEEIERAADLVVAAARKLRQKPGRARRV